MIGPTEAITDVVYALRLVRPGQWLLRLLCGATLAAAAVLCATWFPIVSQELLLAIIAVAGVWALARPESWASLVAIAVVALWWLGTAGDAQWWQSAVLAGLLAAFHLTVAQCAAAPSYTAIGGGAALSWLVRGLGYLVVCAGMILLVVGVASLSEGVAPRGLWWVAAALAAVVTSTVLAVLRVKGKPGRQE